jgi:tetratricopeptide (TPR) repeat protein
VDPSPADSNSDSELELDRLRQKLSATSDPDIRAALSSRIEILEQELQTSAKTEVPDKELNESEKQQLRSELAKVSAQRYAVEDPEVRAQLQARVKELQELLGIDVQKLAGGEMAQNAVPEVQPAKAKKTKESTTPKVDLAELQAILAEKSALIRKEERQAELNLPDQIEPPTPEQQETADRLIQQARVEKIRGNKAEVQRLLEQAASTAPGSAIVLEMVGDDYAERKQLAKAAAYYRRAAKIDPKNVNIERKLALAALGVSDGAGQLSPGLDDSAIPMASRNAAIWLSLFLPGLGHLVLGQKSKGILILAVWCVCLAWVILMGGDVAKVGSALFGGRSQANWIVVVPLLVMILTFVGAMMDLRGPKETVRQPVARPRPPVDLPFE